MLKMLKSINSYWFHNDTSEKNNSLNGHSNNFVPEDNRKINNKKIIRIS